MWLNVHKNLLWSVHLYQCTTPKPIFKIFILTPSILFQMNILYTAETGFTLHSKLSFPVLSFTVPYISRYYSAACYRLAYPGNKLTLNQLAGSLLGRAFRTNSCQRKKGSRTGQILQIQQRPQTTRTGSSKADMAFLDCHSLLRGAGSFSFTQIPRTQ